MTKNKEIEDLEEFIKALRKWPMSSSEEREKLRSRINKKKAVVKRIVEKAGCGKTITINPPPAIGGAIMNNIDPFAMIFDRPYGIIDMMIPVIDMVEETIGVISLHGDDESDTKCLQSPLFWVDIHPKVREVAKTRYESGHFADAVESALKLVNKTVKDIVRERSGDELDGAALMNKAFSPKAPIITLYDLSTETGKNIQQGYMQIFAGSMTGIRNPKAHNIIIIDDKRARHHIYLASLLLYVLDDFI
ncbi:TIGR02391 family protein [Candidatus Latescibacterota bacterium]